MKTQAKKRLTFKKTGIIELNNSEMSTINGGTSAGIVTITTNDPDGTTPLCFSVQFN